MKYLMIYVVCLTATLSVNGTPDWEDYNSGKLAKIMTVDLNGGDGSYKSVQSAIDSIPSKNQQWIRIFIKAGIYKENVKIPKDKGYINMQGEGIQKTIIANNGHKATDISATFTAYSDNIVISGITFQNTYNLVSLVANSRTKPIVQAVAARMLGDKYVITDSSFDGVQDTLFDALGRHYYKRCVFSGGIDVIFGYAQSLFEKCTLNLTVGVYAPERPYGTITAQGRKSPEDKGGFVFKHCIVKGKGKALLGRAWGAYARVIFSNCKLSEAILPIGWDAWRAKGREYDTTFVEYGCTGAGANKSQRVSWLKNESLDHIKSLTSLSFIDQDGWIASLPFHI